MQKLARSVKTMRSCQTISTSAGEGVSLLDIPHRWVTSGTYVLPFGKGKRFFNQGGIVDALLGGWRFSGIFTLQSGQPFSPYALTPAGHTNTGVSVVNAAILEM